MKHSLVECPHLVRVCVIVGYEALVFWGDGAGSFIVEEVDE